MTDAVPHGALPYGRNQPDFSGKSGPLGFVVVPRLTPNTFAFETEALVKPIGLSRV